MYIVSILYALVGIMFIGHVFLWIQVLRLHQKSAVILAQNFYDKQTLASERMLLFLERIYPPKLCLRLSPISLEPNIYLLKLMEMIEIELDHNLLQQLYIKPKTWKLINITKNKIRLSLTELYQNKKEEITDSQSFQKIILNCSWDISTITKVKRAIINDVTPHL